MDTIDTIICRNNTQELITEIKKRLGVMDMKDIYLIDSSEDEVVILVSSESINKQVADAFWLGYKKALE